jgi:putative transposase
MSHYRRCYIPGCSFFFTVVTERRWGIVCTDLGRACLRAAFRDCLQQRPFRLDAIVLLPEHFHAIFTLPPGDSDYSKRLGSIKKRFTETWLAAGGAEQPRTASRRRYRRRGVWQRRFWEHALRDERDYARHVDYRELR